MPDRLCLVCRQRKPQRQLLRLTVDHQSGAVFVNSGSPEDRKRTGRSAYLCATIACIDAALKGNRLKGALEGRRSKNAPKKRHIAWPLESQLIHTLRRVCTEQAIACHNTE